MFFFHVFYLFIHSFICVFHFLRIKWTILIHTVRVYELICGVCACFLLIEITSALLRKIGKNVCARKKRNWNVVISILNIKKERHCSIYFAGDTCVSSNSLCERRIYGDRTYSIYSIYSNCICVSIMEILIGSLTGLNLKNAYTWIFDSVELYSLCPSICHTTPLPSILPLRLYVCILSGGSFGSNAFDIFTF